MLTSDEPHQTCTSAIRSSAVFGTSPTARRNPCKSNSVVSGFRKTGAESYTMIEGGMQVDMQGEKSERCLVCSTCDKTSELLFFVFEVRTWFEVCLPSLLLGHLFPAPLASPVNSGEKRHIYHRAFISLHTFISSSSLLQWVLQRCRVSTQFPFARIYEMPLFPPCLLNKDRCSLSKQVWGTDWASASVPGIKRLDLPLSTN